jgi:hypothetical protein
MTLAEKKKKLQSLKEAELRRDVLLPLLTATGFSDVHEVHGPTEKGRDIFFRETTKLGESVACVAVVSIKDITGTVGKQNSAQRILDQVQTALNQPIEDRYKGRSVEVDRCWVITSGRILSSAMERISGSLQKSNLSKVVYFVDIDRLVSLIDQQYPDYWTNSRQTPAGPNLQRHVFSPDQRLSIYLEYSLTHAEILNPKNGKTLLVLPTDQTVRSDVITLWCPDSSLLAYYSPQKRGGWTEIIQVGESSARILERSRYELPCLEQLKREGIRHRGRFDNETPVAWRSKSRLVLHTKGLLRLVLDPPEYLDYEYEVEIECEDGNPKLTSLREISLVRFKE